MAGAAPSASSVRRRRPGPAWSVAGPVMARLARQLAGAAVLLVGCGFGYWWLEPNTPTLADGLWLAFVTAATVGYGDVVPSTPAAKLFTILVVLIGFGVLSLVTAAIAAIWVGAQEREVEQDILRDLHAQMRELRREIAELRAALPANGGSAPPPLEPRPSAQAAAATGPGGATAAPADLRTAGSRPSRTPSR